MTVKIESLNDGDIVTDGNEYATVKACVHGNPYYAYFGTEKEVAELVKWNDLKREAFENAIEVSDLDENHIECCS